MAKSDTPHWDTPYGTPRPGSGKKKLIILLVIVGVIVGGVCLFWKLPDLLKKKREADGETDITADDGEKTKTAENETKKEKSKELQKLNHLISRLKKLERKVDKTRKSFIREREEARGRVKTLDEQKPQTKRIKRRLAKAIAEFKEIDGQIKSLEKMRDDYIDQRDDLQITIRRVRRQIELAEFGKDKQKEFETMFAEASARVHKAEKDADSMTIDSGVGGDDDDDDGDPVVEDGDLNDILNKTGE